MGLYTFIIFTPILPSEVYSSVSASIEFFSHSIFSPFSGDGEEGVVGTGEVEEGVVGTGEVEEGVVGMGEGGALIVGEEVGNAEVGDGVSPGSSLWITYRIADIMKMNPMMMRI